MPPAIKAQVLIITVFSILLTSIVIFALFLPILNQLRFWQETTDSYQALANAEAGLEIEMLNQSLSGEDLMPPSEEQSSAEKYNDRIKSNFGSNCDLLRNNPPNSNNRVGRTHDCQRGRVRFNLNVSTSTYFDNIIQRIDSEGISGRFNRTLFITTIISSTQQSP